MTAILQPGTPAPEFDLYSTGDKKISLKDFKGQPIILLFYPADWSPTCTSELAIFNEILPEFRKHNTEIMGISVDGKWCHEAFSKENNIRFPLLADFEPKGEVARQYGVYLEKEGYSERAIFLIDKERKILWSYLSPLKEVPGADGILEALENLTK
jgi:peroxiredoxin